MGKIYYPGSHAFAWAPLIRSKVNLRLHNDESQSSSIVSLRQRVICTLRFQQNFQFIEDTCIHRKKPFTFSSVKSLDAILAGEKKVLQRTLGVGKLTLLGVGAIIYKIPK